jgi:hypothetical protein
MHDITSRDLARELGLSQRQAQRLLKEGTDPRIPKADFVWRDKFNRKQLAEACINKAVGIEVTALSLRNAIEDEPCGVKAEIERIRAAIRLIHAGTTELQAVAEVLHPTPLEGLSAEE